MKLIVCESCEAVFKLTHNMDEKFYEIKYCPFCAEDLDDEELEDEIDDYEED